MKRKAISSILLSAFMFSTCCFQTSCRSTLYKAAEQGNIDVVRAELAKGKSIDSYAKGPQNIFLLPAGAIALTIDTANLALMIGTLGIYYHCLPTDRPFLLPRMLKNPIDAALDGGHYEIANLLARHGDKPIYSKHYHGGKTASQNRQHSTHVAVPQSTAQRPVKQVTAQAKPKQQAKKGTPKPQPVKTNTPEPPPQKTKKKLPSMQSAAGSVN